MDGCRSIGKAKISLCILLSCDQRNLVCADAGQFIAGSATHGHGIKTGRQMGEEIETINGLGRCDKTIGAMQCDQHASERRLLVGFLCAVAIGIKINKVANRPQRLESDSVAGPVVAGDGVANGAGVGGVGDCLGAVGGGRNADNGGRLGRKRADSAGKATAAQVTTGTGDGIEKHARRLGISDGDAGNGDPGGVAHGDGIGKGCADGDGSRASFGDGDITLRKLAVVGARGGRANRAIGAGQRPLAAAAGISAVLGRSNALAVGRAGWGSGC
jgi:hypothetical protein